MTKTGKNLLIWKSHVTRTRRAAYTSNGMQLKIILQIILSATSVLSRSPIAYNTTASLDKLTWTDYVDYVEFFTHDKVFICKFRNKKAVFWIICIKSGYQLEHYSCHLLVVSFSEQINLKNRIILLFVKTSQKMKAVPYMEKPCDDDRKRKEDPYMEKSRNNDQKRCV